MYFAFDPPRALWEYMQYPEPKLKLIQPAV